MSQEKLLKNSIQFYQIEISVKVNSGCSVNSSSFPFILLFVFFLNIVHFFF